MAVALFRGSDLILIEGAEVDAKLTESHRFSATPTTFAIENGAVASDHIVESPDTLEITWVMGNIDGDGQSFGSRAATLLETLKSRISSRSLYQVVTRHMLYPSMAITAVQADHMGPFTGGLRGRISFQSVSQALLERVSVPAGIINGDRSKTASSQTDQGRTTAKEPSAADQTKARPSFLKQLAG